MSKKNAYYFSHDCNARRDEKLLAVRMRHKAEGYGVYFMIVEMLAEEPTHMCLKDYNMIAFELRVGAETVKSIIVDFGLFQFTEDGERFYSESLMERMSDLDDLIEKRREAGRKGGVTKAKRSKSVASATENCSKSVASATENCSNAKDLLPDFVATKLKEKEKKEDITFSSLRSENASDGEPPDTETDADGINYAKLIAYWNNTTKGRWGKIESIDNNRRKMVRARIAQHGKKRFMEAIEQVVQSEFLAAAPWFNFDWLIRPNNFDKVISGNFDNKQHPTNGNTSNTRTEASRRAVTKPTNGYETDF